MPAPNLRQLDLNLLRTLDVLLRERNVTRAARALHRTQSATSHALARLRSQLGDALLVPHAGGMVPTAYAEAVADEVRRLLRDIERVLAPRELFDPANAKRRFRLVLPDFAASLFAALCARLMREAPGVALDWLPPAERSLAQLTDGDLELALLPAKLSWPEGVDGQNAGTLSWACAVRQGHPAVDAWNAQTWAMHGHVVVRLGERAHQPVETALRSLGLRRKVAATVPNFGAVPALLERTDLIATLPETVLRDMAQYARLRLLPLPEPVALPPVDFNLYWSRRFGDAAVLWLRDRVAEEVSAALTAP